MAETETDTIEQFVSDLTALMTPQYEGTIAIKHKLEEISRHFPAKWRHERRYVEKVVFQFETNVEHDEESASWHEVTTAIGALQNQMRMRLFAIRSGE